MHSAFLSLWLRYHEFEHAQRVLKRAHSRVHHRKLDVWTIYRLFLIGFGPLLLVAVFWYS